MFKPIEPAPTNASAFVEELLTPSHRPRPIRISDSKKFAAHPIQRELSHEEECILKLNKACSSCCNSTRFSGTDINQAYKVARAVLTLEAPYYGDYINAQKLMTIVWNSASTCKCCPRHIYNRPDDTKRPYISSASPTLHYDDKTCECPCRHVARWIMRDVHGCGRCPEHKYSLYK